jgi:hypothetical protein
MRSADWLLMLPVHLGDAICTAVLIDKCFSSSRGPDAVDIFTSSHLVPLFAGVQTVRRVYDYEHFSPEQLPPYELTIDLANHPLAAAARVTTRHDRLIFRDLSQGNIIRACNGQGAVLAEFDAPTFNSALTGRAADMRLPIWAFNAPLIAYALGETIWEWLDQGFAPRLRLRGEELEASSDNRARLSRIALVPCGSQMVKRWPERYWSRIADLMSAQGFDLSVVFGPREANQFPDLRSRSNLHIVERFNLRDLARFFLRMDLVISNDCGPMHLAAAVGRPIIALFGPTDPRCWFIMRLHRHGARRGSGLSGQCQCGGGLGARRDRTRPHHRRDLGRSHRHPQHAPHRSGGRTRPLLDADRKRAHGRKPAHRPDHRALGHRRA